MTNTLEAQIKSVLPKNSSRSFIFDLLKLFKVGILFLIDKSTTLFRVLTKIITIIKKIFRKVPSLEQFQLFLNYL